MADCHEMIGKSPGSVKCKQFLLSAGDAAGTGNTMMEWRPWVQIPCMDDCIQMMAGMQMPDHIRNHSLLVCRVALCLTDELALIGVALNRPLVIAGALLHDITKTRSFQTMENHAQTGGEYLSALGFPEVGEIVRQHVVLDEYFAREDPIEAEVVNYADKRVLHDRIVPLDERMTYILERYADTLDRQILLKQLWNQTTRLEKRLFGYLAFSPMQLAQWLPRD